MKLLERKLISSDFQVQKKLQIDEGVALARRVDALRETLISLECQHKKFIEGMRQDLINQTKVLEDRKSAVLGELGKLEERRKELLRPLENEWLELSEAKIMFHEKQRVLVNKENQLDERDRTIKKTEKTTEQDRQQILTLKGEIENAKQETLADQRIAKDLRKQTDNERIAQNKDFTQKNKEINKQIDDLVVQRKYLDLVKENLEVRKKDLDNKEQAINDKYKTLMRTINRK